MLTGRLHHSDPVCILAELTLGLLSLTRRGDVDLVAMLGSLRFLGGQLVDLPEVMCCLTAHQYLVLVHSDWV